MAIPTILPPPTHLPFNKNKQTRYSFKLELPPNFFDGIVGHGIVFPADPSNFGKYTPAGVPIRLQPRALVFHTPEEKQDDWESTPNWFANPAANASTHWYADDDGDLYQMLSEADCSWGQGTVAGRNRHWKGAINGLPSWSTGDHNLYAIGIEVEGIASTFRWKPAQRTSVLRWATYKALQYNIPFDRTHFVAHSELSTQRSDPGPGFAIDAFLADCIELRDEWLNDTLPPELTKVQAAWAAWENGVKPLSTDGRVDRYILERRRK